MKPEINYRALAEFWEGDHTVDRWDEFLTFIKDTQNHAYEMGRSDVLAQGEARTALLDGQAHWLDAADKSENVTGVTVAKVIAQAFADWADAYRTSGRVRPSLECPEDVQMELVDDDEQPPLCEVMLTDNVM